MSNDLLNGGLLLLVAVVTPWGARWVPFAVPATVLQIATGVLLGPSLFGVLHVDGGVRVLSGMGMAYLLFASGMELQRGSRSTDTLRPAAISVLLAGATAGVSTLALTRGAHLGDGPAVFVALVATLIMPAVAGLRGAAHVPPALAGVTLVSAALGDIVAVIVVLISALRSSTAVASAALVALVIGGLVVLRATVGPDTTGRRARRPRIASDRVLALAILATLAAVGAAAFPVGVELVTIAVSLGLVCSAGQRSSASWGRLRRDLDVVGLRVLAPLSFVAAGARIDLALVANTHDELLVAGLFGAMVLCRAAPAILLWRRSAGWRPAVGSGLLLSTKLTLVVVAVQLGLSQGSLTATDASILLTASVLTVVILPTAARRLLGALAVPTRAGEQACAAG